MRDRLGAVLRRVLPGTTLILNGNGNGHEALALRLLLGVGARFGLRRLAMWALALVQAGWTLAGWASWALVELAILDTILGVGIFP